MYFKIYSLLKGKILSYLKIQDLMYLKRSTQKRPIAQDILKRDI